MDIVHHWYKAKNNEVYFFIELASSHEPSSVSFPQSFRIVSPAQKMIACNTSYVSCTLINQKSRPKNNSKTKFCKTSHDTMHRKVLPTAVSSHMNDNTYSTDSAKVLITRLKH